MSRVNSDGDCDRCNHAKKDHRYAFKRTREEGLLKNVIRCTISGCDCSKLLSFSFTKVVSRAEGKRILDEQGC